MLVAYQHNSRCWKWNSTSSHAFSALTETLLRTFFIISPQSSYISKANVSQGRLWGGNRGQCPRNSESGPPVAPPDRDSASILQWQIFCTDFVLKGKVEIKCVSSLLSNKNCWNCKHLKFEVWFILCLNEGFVFFPGLYVPPTKEPAQPGPPIKTGLEPPLTLHNVASNAKAHVNTW